MDGRVLIASNQAQIVKVRETGVLCLSVEGIQVKFSTIRSPCFFATDRTESISHAL